MSNRLYRDPHFLGVEANQYGKLADITIHKHSSDVLLWSCTIAYPGQDRMTTGGFSGPFEALAHALQQAKELAKMTESESKA